MGVSNPLDLFKADPEYLRKRIFKSVVGVHWHMRMRGWEVDDREFKRKSIGHQYALSNKTADREELAKLLMKLCEKVGRKLRSDNYYATGVHLYLAFVPPRRDMYMDAERSFSSRNGTRRKQSYGDVSSTDETDAMRQKSQQNGGFADDFTGSVHDPDHIGFENQHKYRSWHKGHKLGYRLYSTTDIYNAAKHLLSQAEIMTGSNYGYYDLWA